jgi:hypothetical protein
MQSSSASTARLESNSEPQFLTPIGATTSTHSLKRVHLHFVQHHRPKAHTRQHSKFLAMTLFFWQKVLINWERIKALHTKQAIENNAKENKKRLEHKYKVGDKVLLVFKPYEWCNKILPSTYARGPFEITEVMANGTVKIQCGAYMDIISIHRITPYHPREE